MTIIDIIEIKNPNQKDMKPIKEKQDIYIPDIVDQNISRRNGMIYLMSGSGGSGKSSLLLNMFKNKDMYRNKFHNIYYFCPASSMQSVVKHPFEKHEKVYHELTVGHLESIYQELLAMKEEATKEKSKEKVDPYGDEKEEEEEKEIEYSCIIIDDFANNLKDIALIKQLSKMVIKARHICCSFIFTTQSFYYLDKIIRKQLTYTTIFKPKNIEEGLSIMKELMNLNKEDGLKMFNYVFDAPYNHLDIDLVNDIYYKNFNKLEIKF